MALVGRRLFGHVICRRHLFGAAAGLAVALGLLVSEVLPDIGLRWALVRGLRDLGMVEIATPEADVSLFQGNVVIHRMLARPPSGPALGLREFALEFRWAPLLERRLVIDRMRLGGAEVHVARGKEGGLVIQGLPLALSAAPDQGEAAGQGKTSWAFDLASLELEDSRLTVTDGDARLEIAVERLLVENLHTRDPARAVGLTLEGRVNGAPVRLQARALAFAERPSAQGSLKAEGLALEALAAFATRAGVEGLAGNAGLDLEWRIAVAESGALAARVSGKADIAAPALTAPVVVKAARTALAIDHAAWEEGRLTLSAVLDTDGLTVKARDGGGQAEALSLKLGEASWDGRMLALVRGRLVGNGLMGRAGGNGGTAQRLDLDAERLTWDGRLEWSGGLGLTGAKVNAEGLEIAPDALTWKGTLALDATRNTVPGKAEGRLELGPFAFKGLGYVLNQRQAHAEGWLSFGQDGALPVAARLRLGLEGLTLREPARGLDWLEARSLNLGTVSVGSDGAIASDRITAQGLAAIRRDGARGGRGGYNWRFEVGTLRLDGPERDAGGDLEAEALSVDGGTVRLARIETGFEGLPPISDSKPARASPDESPGLTLGRLEVDGVRLVFVDRTVPEPVRLEAQGVALSLSNLDSERPDQDSPFSLKARLGEAKVSAKGAARPFAQALGGRLDARIEALELPPFSPYLAQALGVNLRTGQFGGQFGGTATAGALDGTLAVELANLVLAPPDARTPPNPRMNLPVETVLNLLKDGEGHIRLSFPVKGDTANPDLDVSDAVAQAVSGALRSTLMATLKLAFPLAALFELAEEAGKDALGLPSLAFAPGSAQLEEPARAVLADAARLLASHSDLRLTLCGKAVPEDWPPLAATRRAADRPLLARLEKWTGLGPKPDDAGPPDPVQMARLADLRTQAAKRHLVEAAGLEPGRVFTCRAEVEGLEGGKGPRVDLLL